MTGYKTDFERLLRLQRLIKAMRERELADAKGRKAAAERSLDDLARMMNDGGPIVRLFPDLLANYFQSTLADKADAERQIRETGDELLREKRKLETIETRHVEQRSSQIRDDEAQAQSETIDQRITRGMSASSKLGKIGSPEKNSP